jgi:ATP-binding cassette subfamily F protein 3
MRSKQLLLKTVIKLPMKSKKGKALQNRLSNESQIKQLEKDIQHDDKMLASNYNKNIEDASFFKAYNKRRNRVR